MKNFKITKVYYKVIAVLAWLNVRERINNRKFELDMAAYNAAGDELDLLYHATIGKIYEHDEPLEDIAQWYESEKSRIHQKYGFKEDLTSLTFKDIYNNYCITERQRQGWESDPDFIPDDMIYDLPTDELELPF